MYVMEVTVGHVPFDDGARAAHMMDWVKGRLPMQYLKAFDPEARGGRGSVVLTDNLNEAMQFDTLEAVFAAWKTQSATTPLRPDGKPNRPLTAFSMSPCRVLATRNGLERVL